MPDHQEVFLSSNTLSNLIIEINQRVSEQDALNASAKFTRGTVPPSGCATPQVIDHGACLYHLVDFCDAQDKIEVISSPERIDVPGVSSSSPAPVQINAYKCASSITTQKRDAHRDSTDGPPPSSTVTCHYLLIRLEEQETDILAWFNVPHDEFLENGDVQGLTNEIDLAKSTIDALASKLEIKDWGLFV